jgi:hypothetical protein
MQGPEPYPMPRNFVTRYVVGKISLFAPMLWAPAIVFAFVKWQMFLLLFGAFTLVLLL